MNNYPLIVIINPVRDYRSVENVCIIHFCILLWMHPYGMQEKSNYSINHNCFFCNLFWNYASKGHINKNYLLFKITKL